MEINRRQYMPLLVLGLITLAFVGCQRGMVPDYASLGLLEVTGTVRLDGQPLAGAKVIFTNDDSSLSFATTDANGGYRLNYDTSQTGILPGNKIVSITGGKGDKRVPTQYNKRTTLTADVQPGKQTFDFDLTSS